MSTLTIGVAEKNRNPYWDMVNAGWSDAAERLDLSVNITAPESENAEEQAELMRAHLDAGVDALAFVGTNPAMFEPIVADAARRGIPVVAFDLDAPTSGRALFVGMERPLDAGRRAGRNAAAVLEPGATVLVQTGSDRAPGAVGKKAGFLEVMAEQGFRVVELENDHEDAVLARETAEAALAAHPEAACLFGVYGYHPVSQAAAVRSLGRVGEVKVVGFDMLPETVHLIESGEVTSSIWIQEYQFGYLAAAAIADLVRLGTEEALTLFGMSFEHRENNIRVPTPITYSKENIHEFVSWSRQRAIAERTTATAF